jgi:hypothetical protein
MRSRPARILVVSLLFLTALAASRAATAPLRVTYYYLPG